MKARMLMTAAIVLCAATAAHAIYGVSNEGAWPEDWPKELEPLRKQARTLIGPEVMNRHYAIPFGDRDAFEAAWPHVLSVKSKRAPIFLSKGPNFFLGDDAGAGGRTVGQSRDARSANQRSSRSSHALDERHLRRARRRRRDRRSQSHFASGRYANCRRAIRRNDSPEAACRRQIAVDARAGKLLADAG
jgi:hypothetical protein